MKNTTTKLSQFESLELALPEKINIDGGGEDDPRLQKVIEVLKQIRF